MDLSPLLYVPDTGSARRNVLPRNELRRLKRRSATASWSRCWPACRQTRTRPCGWRTRSTTPSARSARACRANWRCATATLACLKTRSASTFTGNAGQSFGAFAIRGLSLYLTGAANDYVGKGLGGGEIVVRPPEDARFVPHQNVILGNTALYGATGGQAVGRRRGRRAFWRAQQRRGGGDRRRGRTLLRVHDRRLRGCLGRDGAQLWRRHDGRPGVRVRCQRDISSGAIIQS